MSCFACVCLLCVIVRLLVDCVSCSAFVLRFCVCFGACFWLCLCLFLSMLVVCVCLFVVCL